MTDAELDEIEKKAKGERRVCGFARKEIPQLVAELRTLRARTDALVEAAEHAVDCLEMSWDGEQPEVVDLLERLRAALAFGQGGDGGTGGG